MGIQAVDIKNSKLSDKIKMRVNDIDIKSILKIVGQSGIN